MKLDSVLRACSAAAGAGGTHTGGGAGGRAGGAMAGPLRSRTRNPDAVTSAPGSPAPAQSEGRLARPDDGGADPYRGTPAPGGTRLSRRLNPSSDGSAGA